jgi:hypothetical protein
MITSAARTAAATMSSAGGGHEDDGGAEVEIVRTGKRVIPRPRQRPGEESVGAGLGDVRGEVSSAGR